MLYVRLALCWLLLVNVPVAAAQVARIGDAKGLDTLKRMQGGWHIACQSLESSSGTYYRVFLTVSFTHFDFETREFADPDCNDLRGSHRVQYRFVLGDEQLLQDGEHAFAINFQQQSFESGAYQLTPLNLIRVHRGRLTLAAPSERDTQMRPEALDYTQSFVR